MNRPERPKTKLVEVPSTNIIPERDIGMPPILETRHLGIDFGGLTAVSDFNFAVGRTEIAGLIGPNGAGKPQFSTCSRRSISRRAAPSCSTAWIRQGSPPFR